MTASFAAGTLGSAPDTDGAYEPGICNIGPMEIARRRMVGHVGLAATLAVVGILIAVETPPPSRLLAAIPAMISASGYLQAHLRFCAGYGQRGLFNFGESDDAEAVVDEAARAMDRRKARQISLWSLGIGVAVGLAGVLLPF